MVAIGDDYWIENNRSERAFAIEGKALRLRQTLVFEDAQCRVVQRTGEGGSDREVQSNVVDQEYTIAAGRGTVAEVSSRWSRDRNT